jgi:replicative DNA helicase
VARETVLYIDKRRKGIEKSLKTRWEKFNTLCMGGIEPNAVYTVAGISGSGKSSFVNMLETDILDLNPTDDVVVLSFSFEMLSTKQVGRKISAKLKKTTSNLYSTKDGMDDFQYNYVVNTAKGLIKYPIYYVDTPSTVDAIRDTVNHFHETIAKGKWLIIILDHTLLVNGDGGERSIIVDLQKYFIEAKKIGKTSIIQVSQMNRDIEKPERINNPMLHYPMRSDLSSSDSVFQGSDYVIVIHRPETLQILQYGPRGLPTRNIVYLHFLKNREGELKILQFVNKLEFNTLEEPIDKKNDGQQTLNFENAA